MAHPAFLIASAWAAEDVQQIVLHTSFGDLRPDAVVATVQQADTSRTITLTDDGTDIHDAIGDRVWTGSLRGPPAQFVTVTLTVDSAGRREEVYTGTIRVGMEATASLAFQVLDDEEGHLVGARRATASPGRLAHATETVPIMAAVFWSVFLFCWGAVAMRRSP